MVIKYLKFHFIAFCKLATHVLLHVSAVYELLSLVRLFCHFWVLLRSQMLVPGYKHRILCTVSVFIPDAKSGLC